MITIYESQDAPMAKDMKRPNGLNPFMFTAEQRSVETIEELSELLKALEDQPFKAVTRHRPKVDGVFRRKGNMEAQAVPWLCLDYDGGAPAGCPDYLVDPEAAILWMIENGGWDCLRGVGIHWQLGNSAGVKLEKMSLHLWVMTDRPILDARGWLARHGFDAALMNLGQIHITGNPLNAPDLGCARSGLIKGGVLTGVAEEPAKTVANEAQRGQLRGGCPDYVRDAIIAEARSAQVSEGGRNPWAMVWTWKAISAGLDVAEVKAVAAEELERMGYSAAKAEHDAREMTDRVIEKMQDGAMAVRDDHRPDLDFSDDEEDATVEDADAQARALGCGSLVEGLRECSDRFDWLKENRGAVAKLDTLELARVRDTWGRGVREFDKIVRAARRGGVEVQKGQVFSFEDWAAVAEGFSATVKGLVYSDEVFYSYEGKCYERIGAEVVAKWVSDYMKECYFEGDEAPVMIRPNAARVANALQQVRFSVMRRGLEAAMWLDTGVVGGVPFANGVFYGGELREHTPEFFSTYVLEYDYKPEAVCPLWEDRVEDWLDGDQERIELLRQWMRYLLEGRDNLQKIMVLTGVPRSGKGTITTLLRCLLGWNNCSAPLMNQFSSEFGLENSVGKRAIIIGDAHVKKGDPAGVLDKLKSISGKDVIQVNRKRISQVDVKLGQLILACNDMADIPDESNALISRYSILNFKKSFAGQEDPDLLDNLKSELSGIYNWAMAGEDFTRFVETAEEKEIKDGLIASANPVRAWANSSCEEDPFETVAKEELYKSFERWCEENNSRRKSKGEFFKTLKSVFPYAKPVRVRQGCGRVQAIEGIRILGEGEATDDHLEAF